MRLTEKDIGNNFICKNGRVVKLVGAIPNSGWHKFRDDLGLSRSERGEVFSYGEESPFDLVGPAPKVQRPRANKPMKTKSQKEDKQMKKQTTPVKYFVGKLEKVPYGSPYRIFRRLTKGSGLMKRQVEEISTAQGWKKPKVKYKQSSNLLLTREAARAEKKKWEGRPVGK